MGARYFHPAMAWTLVPFKRKKFGKMHPESLEWLQLFSTISIYGSYTYIHIYKHTHVYTHIYTHTHNFIISNPVTLLLITHIKEIMFKTI